VLSQPTPAVPAMPPAVAPPTPPTEPVPAPMKTSLDSGVLKIWVPEDAQVFINGYQTTSTGNLRQYISHGLQAGLNYNYKVRAVIVRDGRTQEETQTVVLTAGAQKALAFSFDAKSAAGLASAW
jgi:uncharacterized protein (TIGR03000 family)